MKEEKIKILYVDDEEHNLNAFKAHFRIDKRLEIHTSPSGEEGLKILKNNSIHIVVSDQKMPQMTGIEFLEKAKMEFYDIVCIVVTAHRDLQILEDAKNRGYIFGYHDKPWDLDYLGELINHAYEEYCKGKNKIKTKTIN